MDLWTAAWLGVKAAKLLERVEFLWKSDSGQDFYSFFFFSHSSFRLCAVRTDLGRWRSPASAIRLVGRQIRGMPETGYIFSFISFFLWGHAQKRQSV